MALKSDGEVVTWGNNGFGVLGDGTTTQRLSPVVVTGLNLGVSAISSHPTNAAPISNARVFSYAEANVPSLFAGTPAAGQVTYQNRQFNYRCYPTSGNCLAVDSVGVVSILGPYTGNVLTDFGTVESFRTDITNWEVAAQAAQAAAAAAQAAQAAADAAAAQAAAQAAPQDSTRYLPHAAGNQWSYVNNNNATMTNTIGSPVTLPSGVVAIPWTRVDTTNCASSCVTYNTFDASGWLRYQEYISSVYISGYGNTSATSVFAPALSIAPASVTVGSTYTSTGAVTITYTNVTTVSLNYSATTQVVGFETVSNNAGTQSWSAMKVITSVTVSGTVNGQFLTITSASTYWLVDGLGVVKAYIPNASGTMETWKLTSTNVAPPP